LAPRAWLINSLGHHEALWENHAVNVCFLSNNIKISLFSNKNGQVLEIDGWTADGLLKIFRKNAEITTK
jgi:hypothetical protein